MKNNDKNLNKPKFKVIGQYIKDLSFENFAAQEHNFSKSSKQLNMDLNIRKKKHENNIYEVTLVFFLEASVDQRKVFLLELSYSNLFKFSDDQDKKLLRRSLLVDCPAIMFPFLRQIVFNLTRDSGFSPINLDNIDFSGLYKMQ